MSNFILSGRAVDVVLAVLALEALAVLVLAPRRRGALLLALLPGALLLLALKAALAGWGWEAIALGLALALPAHLADLRGRLAAPSGTASDRR
ncbi:hypothetical protein [Thermaurantiacus sp.]